MSAADAEAMEGALMASGADAAALGFVKKMAAVEASLASASSRLDDEAAGDGDVFGWADKLYGQSINAVAKGVKSLLSGGRQLAIARAVDALMTNAPGSAEVESFARFDPKEGKGGGGAAAASASSSAGAPTPMPAPFNDAIVFVLGGGNYLEHQGVNEITVVKEKSGLERGVSGISSGLRELDWTGEGAAAARGVGGRASADAGLGFGLGEPTDDGKKSVVYGATEFTTGAEFINQLSLLGKRTGH